MKYVGALFLVILVSFFIGMLASSIALEVKAAKKEPFYFVDVSKFPQQPGVTDVDYWKAVHGTE